MPATLEQVRSRITRAEADEARDLQHFADLLFEKADPGFLDAFDPEALVAMARGGLAFLEGAAGDAVPVDVLNPTFQADGWDAPYTVVRLALADRPFIVDSVRSELRRHELELFHLLHPIYRVERDGDGRVRRLDPPGEAGRFEAFEMYFVERIDDADARERLRDAVARVLGDVVLATEHYHPMREQAVHVRDYLAELAARSEGERAEEIDEYRAFVEWLDDDNYVYLGYREYELMEHEGRTCLRIAPDTGLGILSKVEESAYRAPVPLDEIPPRLRERVTGGTLLIVTKTNAEATVHRPARMDYVGVKRLADDGAVRGEQRFVGLFTSKAHATAAEATPILRRKLRQVLELDHAIPDSHDYKEIVTIFNSMPRTELFWSDARQLHKDIRTVMALEQERGVRLTLRPDPLQRGLAIMVIMPRERFNAEVRRRIQGFLARELEAQHVDYQLAMGEDQAQVRFHFFFSTTRTPDDVDVRELENEVAELTRSWDDHLRERLMGAMGSRRGRVLGERYLPAMDDRYKADTSPTQAVRDVENLEGLESRDFLVDLLASRGAEADHDVSLVKIYHRRRTLVLSEVLPLLENLGFRVLEQVPYQFRIDGDRRGIEVFKVQDEAGGAIDVREHGERLIEALEALLRREADNDRLNRLVLYASLTLRQVALLRAYQMYFAQLSVVTSRRFINDTLLAHPNVARLLVAYFEARFDPELVGDRDEAMRIAEESFADGLAEVRSLPEDRALRGMLDLMRASLRSNYFRDGPVISFKLASDAVSAMPEPRPMFEIGVSGYGVEGVHLRGGKVARGGIRWSDRPDDFRTEVLGLMKTQMTKNAVIVPVGSKGGFVVKHAPQGRDELRAYVREQYRAYVRALLDLTDNRVDGEVVHPEGLVIYDDADPYLVVAADKGTATFSDIANETAAEYDFWLGDAFASGGSHGYDHKEEGITARGAWTCVLRHFRELGRDPRKDAFTAVGIGDMSGDVFGNGMLFSDRTRLVAAFNHLHAFLDPDPDPAASFAERQRLFALPRSSWSDYDPALISEGGGVFDRTAKAVPLSPQVRELLGVQAETMSGQDLVKAILRLDVDLLWNGGIGTYVKAGSERHGEVGDSSNDAVRVDAGELRCKIVGEGGNLGFTQLARVEYALAGGRINTDAIDNAGGVDMSDREVNLKILLQPLVTDGDMTMLQRNRLLEEMTDEVSELVLLDNDRQSLALSLAERRAREDPSLFSSLQDYLEERGGLNPQVEDLPTQRQLQERRRDGKGLTRPELAVLLAYTKMGLYRRLLETDFPDEPRFQHYLFEYFPSAVRERHAEAVRAHPLHREIIATQFTNTVVDLLGVTFVHRTIRDSGATPVEIIRAALVAMEILEVRGFVDRVDALEEVDADARYHALGELVGAVEGIVSWMLLEDLSDQAVSSFVDAYREPLHQLRHGLDEALPRSERRSFRRAARALRKRGFDPELAHEIAGFRHLPTSLGAVEVSRAADLPLEEAAKHFYAIGERLKLGWMRDRLVEMPAEDKWEKIALAGLVMDLRRAQRQLALGYVRARQEDRRLTTQRYLERLPNLLSRVDPALAEIERDDALDLASGTVLVRILGQAGS